MRIVLCLALAACAAPQNTWRGAALGDTHVTAVAADTNVTASRVRTPGAPQVVGATLHDAAPPQGWADPAPAATREAQQAAPSNVNTSPTGSYTAPSGADQPQAGADQPAAVATGVVAPAIGATGTATPTTPVTSPNQVASPATYTGTDNGPGTGNQAATPSTPRAGTQPAPQPAQPTVPPVR